MTTQSQKEKLINEYSTKGREFVENKLGEVKNLMDKFVDCIDEKGVITETGDPTFGKNASDAMAKSTELSVEFAALRDVKNTLDTADKYKKLAEDRTADGDILSPAKNTLDEQLVASLKNIVPAGRHTLKDALKEAVDEGRLNFDPTESKVKTSANLGKDIDTQFSVLMNVFDHTDYPSEILRTGRIQTDPQVVQDIVDIVPRVQLGVGGFRWMEEKEVTNAVAGRGEGVAVPQQQLEYIQREALLKSAGVMLPIVDELRNDEPFLISFVTGRLGVLLRKYTGNQLMTGDGTGNNLNGFAMRSTAAQYAARANGFSDASLGGTTGAQNYGETNQAPIAVYYDSSTTDPRANIVSCYKAATRIEDVGGENPTHIVLKSGTLANIITAQDMNNNFIFPQNSFSANMFPLLGLPIVKDNNMADGRALIGSFPNNCAMGVAGGLNMETGYNGTDFSQFQRTIRLGMRANLGVYSPRAFVWVNGLTT